MRQNFFPQLLPMVAFPAMNFDFVPLPLPPGSSFIVLALLPPSGKVSPAD